MAGMEIVTDYQRALLDLQGTSCGVVVTYGDRQDGSGQYLTAETPEVDGVRLIVLRKNVGRKVGALVSPDVSEFGLVCVTENARSAVAKVFEKWFDFKGIALWSVDSVTLGTNTTSQRGLGDTTLSFNFNRVYGTKSDANPNDYSQMVLNPFLGDERVLVDMFEGLVRQVMDKVAPEK